ncbi:MAG: hypothetical protein V1656_01010 [Candidatus Jorgensenbacteria bacterium]
MNEDRVIQKLVEHDKHFDLIVGKLVEHDKKLDGVVMKDEFQNFKHQVLTAQDEMVTILRRLDQERIFTTAWVGRIEKEVEEHTREIKSIKQILKIQ